MSVTDPNVAMVTDGAGAAQPAWSHAASHARLWVVTAAGLALDLWSKDWAVRHLRLHEPQPLLGDFLSLRLSLNPGALFGIGAGLAPVFVGASVLALVFVVYLFWQCAARQRSLHVALGCVLGGAVGNLYDRCYEAAYVIRTPDGRSDICQQLRVVPEHNEVVVGDFKTGRNPRRYHLGAVTASYEPVVRDFLSIELKVLGRRIWPWIFNVADVLLVVGVGLLMFNFLTENRAAESGRASGDEAAAGAPPPTGT